jgi:release factor glutamine methyltransferase
VEHEPEIALFVPDEDPLWCYRALAALAVKALEPNGVLMVETYHQYHDKLMQQWKENGLRHVTEQDDINGRPRFVMGRV